MTAGIVLWVMTTHAAAQNDRCTELSIPVTVVARDGMPVRGLTAADFRGEYRGQPVQIGSVVVDDGPRRIVILIDATPSMLGGFFSAIKGLAADVVQRTSPNSAHGLVIYGRNLVETVDLSTENLAIAKRIYELQLEKGATSAQRGRTGFSDALAAGLSMLSPARQGDVILALTEGAFKKSRERPSQTEDMLIAQGVRFFWVTPVIPVMRAKTPEEVGRTEFLERLVTSTGGGSAKVFPLHAQSELFWFDEKDRENVLKRLQPLYYQIIMIYQLNFRIPLSPDKPQDCDIEIVNAQGKRRRDVTVFYPRKLLPCSHVVSLSR